MSRPGELCLWILWNRALQLPAATPPLQAARENKVRHPTRKSRFSLEMVGFPDLILFRTLFLSGPYFYFWPPSEAGEPSRMRSWSCRWKPKITRIRQNVVQNKVFEKSFSNCYSSRGFKHGFWAPSRKSVFWPTFFGVPRWNMVLGPGPARPAGPGFAHSGTSQGKCFFFARSGTGKKNT